jgi:hypothetical protein
MIEAGSPQAFWNWFVQHEAMLFNFKTDRERIFYQLSIALHKVDADLTFEFGPKEAKREFVVSAGGIKRAFASVVALAGAAPPLERWTVTAFRPRRWPLNTVELQNKSVDPKDVQFTLLRSRGIAGIVLFLPGFHEDDLTLKQIGYLLLDDALGEYDVESHLGLIEILSPQTPTDGERYPLAELPSRFDRLVSLLEGRSRLVS